MDDVACASVDELDDWVVDGGEGADGGYYGVCDSSGVSYGDVSGYYSGDYDGVAGDDEG